MENQSAQIDILDLIKSDHKNIHQLMEQLASSTHDDKDLRNEVFPHLLLALRAHTSAEEETLYQRLLDHRELQHRIEISYAEHHVVADLLEELQVIEYDDEQWAVKFAALRENFENHRYEEETLLLPEVKKLFSLDLRHEMATQMLGIEERSLHEPINFPRRLRSDESLGARIF